MKKSLWQIDSFNRHSIPDWPCPKCNVGLLKFEKDKFMFFETAESLKNRKDPDFEPEWISYKFAGVLKCINSKCKEIVSFCGDGDVSYFTYFDESKNIDETDVVNVFYPKYFNPALHLFVPSNNCPKVIRNEINSSFSLFWCDLPSCANKIRKTIELILNDRNVKAIKVINNKRVELSLHKRIEEFNKKEPEIVQHLMALKWIGNYGSHIGDINKDNILEAFEILEYILEEIYDKKTKRLNKISKEINKLKGPRTNAVPF
ncbi:MAG: DUF4145 domain-containing protein [Desulfocucumaceae bacterium]